jgi:hypothetical protein
MTKQDILNGVKMLCAALAVAFIAALLGLGCSVDETAFGDGIGALGGHGGAMRSTGGVSATGGAATGGASSSGGAAATGGASGAAGSVDTAGTIGTAGVLGTAGGSGAAGAYVPPKNCYAMQAWSGSNDAYMRPGSACNSCHTFTASGTVYVVSNEQTNCYGVDGENAQTQVLVLLTSLDGNTAVALKTNGAGNFWTNALVPSPAMVSTVYGSGQVRMRGMVTNGDCNSCHGANGFPGRITPP